MTLILRAAPSEPVALEVAADPEIVKRAELPARDGWLEQRVELGRPGLSRLFVRLAAEHVEHVLFHVWAVQPE